MAHKNKQPPQSPKPSAARSLKTAFHKSGTKLSLKQWLRSPGCADRAQQAADWRFNKRVNSRKPQQGLGRTNRTKKGSSSS